METIEDRIIRAEEKFINDNIRSPEWIILTHYGLLELEQEISKNELEDLSHYEGLKIAITSNELTGEFILL